MLVGDWCSPSRSIGRRRLRTVWSREMLAVQLERGRRREYSAQEACDTRRVDRAVAMLGEAGAKYIQAADCKTGLVFGCDFARYLS